MFFPAIDVSPMLILTLSAKNYNYTLISIIDANLEG